MTKQTAVEYLIDELTNDIPLEIILKCHQTFIMAIELEREQIKEAFDKGQECEYQYHVNGAPKFDSETYFIETYK